MRFGDFEVDESFWLTRRIRTDGSAYSPADSGVALRTTLIVGYPGETEEQFEDLCDFVSEAEFDYVGIFAYSPEDGTPAAELPDQIDEDTKQARLQELHDIADSVSSSVVSQRIGTSMDILVLGCEEDGQLYGRAQCQAPRCRWGNLFG